MRSTLADIPLGQWLPMETLAVVLVVVGVLGVGVGLVVIMRLRAEMGRLAERAERVAARVAALPPDLSRVFGNHDRHIISVELLNLFELAHRETWVARPLSVLTPRLLRDVIHRAVVGRVRENLAASGVEADVRLHRVR
ncbi:MAG TPA: hypothetical protein VGX25_22580 [Actinophytocola sp.]|uniref:hypothetical protein n=1 Tax=Actinophytocola sp. TaxID=1872138 RepID=UPI002DDCD5AE|nr:hypothetical protein [Actinophytocola sp.]HEV2782188.1 hypothetical protein [Actinophytocola sp.]